MGKRYRPWNPNQEWLLPPSALDWLPGNDLVYFILDTVRELDISAISAKYEQEERGYPPYHPRMMVALLLYAYCRGIFSSRQIMQACQERISFRVLVSDDIPNFRTSRFCSFVRKPGWSNSPTFRLTEPRLKLTPLATKR